MSDFTVSTNDLRTKASRLREYNAQFRNRRDQLIDTEAGLNGMWEGDARRTFHSAFHSDMVQLQNFYNAIEMYCARLEQIAARYEKAEQVNRQIAHDRSY